LKILTTFLRERYNINYWSCDDDEIKTYFFLLRQEAYICWKRTWFKKFFYRLFNELQQPGLHSKKRKEKQQNQILLIEKYVLIS
jgi:hypothetical protein